MNKSLLFNHNYPSHCILPSNQAAHAFVAKCDEIYKDTNPIIGLMDGRD
jgi:hypothetical protein